MSDNTKSPVSQPAASPEPCAHDYVRKDLVCTECGEKVASANETGAEGSAWRCFHCDEVFTDAESATLHFGRSERQSPACSIDIAEYRSMEQRMHAYNEEDSELHRTMYRMQAQHQTDLRREEEKGYARGLADGMKEHRSPAMAAAAPADERAAFEQHLRDTAMPVLPVWKDGKPYRDYTLEKMWGAWCAARAAASPAAEMDVIPALMYNGDTKRDPALRELLNRQALRHVLTNPRGEGAPQPAQADAPAGTREPTKIDTKARMDWADSILRKLPPLDPTYSIVGIIDDQDPEDRDEVLHSIRVFADMRATQALFTLYSAPADAGEAVAYVRAADLDALSEATPMCPATLYREPRNDERVALYTAPPAARVGSLTDDQINTITSKWAARWSASGAWNTRRCIDNALREARSLLNGADHDQ
ncbi:hypothetical protein [Burkholderia cepacia]|uniref:hypothetical protein n=1 Tax=Burkholderia cepacia TaxID=292 RepID=UPI000755DDF1|nr:hypothetical protein [Burkholderia cepacia]KWH57856.1 hypothetical protein WM00_10240 [Burkholderia cepacia]